MGDRKGWLPWHNDQELLNLAPLLLDSGRLDLLDLVMELKFLLGLFTLPYSIIGHAQAIMSID